jgi:hypothetical protein
LNNKAFLTKIFVFEKGFVAVDDILVHDGQCVTNANLCTFEDSDCGYTNDPLLTTIWEIGTGASQPINQTGPSVDV